MLFPCWLREIICSQFSPLVCSLTLSVKVQPQFSSHYSAPGRMDAAGRCSSVNVFMCWLCVSLHCILSYSKYSPLPLVSFYCPFGEAYILELTQVLDRTFSHFSHLQLAVMTTCPMSYILCPMRSNILTIEILVIVLMNHLFKLQISATIIFLFSLETIYIS